MEEKRDMSEKEQRVREVAKLYYSRKDVQNVLYEFAKNREISPRYFEGFGKRPDIFQYPNDVFALAKNGATSYHCSEELWGDPLRIETGMNERTANELRIGWDVLIDIDCKWFDFSKLAARSIVSVLEKHGVENVGVKFSGSKGFHIILPWKAFPKELAGKNTRDLFPELPRRIVNFIRFEAEKEMNNILPDDFEEQFRDVKIKKGVKCKKCSEISKNFEKVDFFCNNCHVGEERKLEFGNSLELKCPTCKSLYFRKNAISLYECEKCDKNSIDNPNNFDEVISNDIFELMGLDLILVSSRHLFRMPYSLHEKTALASIVIDKDKVMSFEMKDARPENMVIKNFLPDAKENEATELLISALDWESEHRPKDFVKKSSGKFSDYKELELKDIKDEQFPPCIKKILEGLGDGKKRGLFALLHLFRSIGMNKKELEDRLYSWNDKNDVPLKKGYIKSQLDWAYKRKPLMPPNCKGFYTGLGICNPDNTCNYVKNPVNYVVKKNFSANKNEWTGPVGPNGKDAKRKDEAYALLDGEIIEKVGTRKGKGFVNGEFIEERQRTSSYADAKGKKKRKRRKIEVGRDLGVGEVIEKVGRLRTSSNADAKGKGKAVKKV